MGRVLITRVTRRVVCLCIATPGSQSLSTPVNIEGNSGGGGAGVLGSRGSEFGELLGSKQGT